MAALEPALDDEPDNMYLLYGAAMVCAMAEDRERLFDFVRRAVEAGYPREYFRQEPAFAAYSEEPAFVRALVDEPS